MLFRKKPKPEAAVPVEAKARKPWRLSESLMALAKHKPAVDELRAYEPAPGVLPEGVKASALAMDSTPYGYVNQFSVYGAFPGYPYLAELSQLPEYRKITEIRAKEMTRKWIRLVSAGEGDPRAKAKRLKDLDTAIRKYRLRDHFRKALEDDGYFGRGQIYVDVCKPSSKVLASDDPAELKTPLFVNEKKITKGSLVGFRCVEPMWTYPALYNSTDPLHKSYYKPTSWYVMSKEVHDSRLLLFVSRPVPDMLKAAYSFGGLSMSQIAKPYIDNWLRTRDSVSDIVHSFSTSCFKTNMSAVLEGGSGSLADEFFKRVELFNQTRDNRGAMVLDRDTEEFVQVNTPLSGLDALQSQAQEQQAAVTGIPLVKLLGITPSGLNASSDGEIRVFYDDIHSDQEKLIREPLKAAIDIIQLSEFGDIDPDIDFVFEPLYQLSDIEQATARKTDADTDAVLINAGVIAADEARARIAAEADGPYNALEVNDDPEPEEEEEGEETESADTAGATSGKG